MTSFSCFPSPIGPITILAECSVITQIDFSDPPADAIKNDMLPVLQKHTTGWSLTFPENDPTLIPFRCYSEAANFSILSGIFFGRFPTEEPSPMAILLNNLIFECLPRLLAVQWDGIRFPLLYPVIVYWVPAEN